MKAELRVAPPRPTGSNNSFQASRVILLVCTSCEVVGYLERNYRQKSGILYNGDLANRNGGMGGS